MDRRYFVKSALTVPALFGIGLADGQAMRRGEPALDALIAASKAARSGALIVSVNRTRLVEAGESPLQPRHAMSITKPIAGLAILHLIQSGRIHSLDAPVSDFLPAWRDIEEKRAITLRHVVSHRSGLADDDTATPIYAAANCVDYALAAPVVEPPGTRYRYNNRAANLISGVVEAASGQKLHNYLGEHVFKPMGLGTFDWQLDPSGTPYAMTGFIGTGSQLAQIGELLAAGGRSRHGAAVLNPALVARHARATAADGEKPTDGIFWSAASPSGVMIIDAEAVERLSPTIAPETRLWLNARVGQTFSPPQALVDALHVNLPKEIYRKDAPQLVKGLRYESRPGYGYMHTGDSGQFLIIAPEKRLVVARMIDQTVTRENPRAYTFLELGDLVANLAKTI